MAVTKLIDDRKVLKEFVYFLRNSDIFSISTRGVTTTTITGTHTGATTFTISVATVKNIRSIVVGSTTLKYGTDYDYEVNFDTGSAIVCKITYVAAQTGAYTIIYDFGPDKIFDEWPRVDLNISSYPRMVVDFTSNATELASLDGSVTMSDLLISFYIWDNSKNNVRGYFATLRQKILEAQKSFYYVRYVTPVASGPILPEPLRVDKIVMKNLDCRCPLNEEITS